MADTKISALPAATTPLAGTEVLPIVQGGTTDKVAVSDLTAGRTVNAANFISSSNSAFGGKVIVGATSTPTNDFEVQSPTGGNCLIKLGGAGTGQTGVVLASAGAFDPYFNLFSSGNTLNAGFAATNATGDFYFYTGTSATEVLRLVNSTKDVKINTGNLIQGTAAKGINFTANTPAAGMTSQLLNWYEEGTFAPTIEGSTSAGTVSYVVREGTYTRIGRVVYFQIYLVWDSGTGTGDLYVGGLPFQSAGGGSAFGGAFAPVLLNVALSANNYCTGAYVLNSNTKMRFFQTPAGGGAASAVPYDAAGECMLVGSYFV